MVALAPNTFFLYHPKHDKPFSFTTHLKNDPNLQLKGGRGGYQYPKGWKIEPGEMVTTGASVPRNLWHVRGFAPFDFTRAALIHDWLYEAHHRWIRAKTGYDAAKATGDRKAMSDNERDMHWYANYANITQDNAADIFAECIKATMEESEKILADFTGLSNGGTAAQANRKTLQGLIDALKYNHRSPLALWIYHYCVSTDCIVKTSVRMWDHPGDDVQLYSLLTSPEVERRAREIGYLSPWLINRFKDILKAEQKRHQDYENAKRTLGIVQASPRMPVTAEAASAPITRGLERKRP